MQKYFPQRKFLYNIILLKKSFSHLKITILIVIKKEWTYIFPFLWNPAYRMWHQHLTTDLSLAYFFMYLNLSFTLPDWQIFLNVGWNQVLIRTIQTFLHCKKEFQLIQPLWRFFLTLPCKFEHMHTLAIPILELCPKEILGITYKNT